MKCIIFFAKWVYRNEKRFIELLKNGERIVGEWLLQAHGTRYNLPHEPFVVFDIMVKNTRLTYISFIKRIAKLDFVEPKLLHIGQPIGIKQILKKIEISGHGAIDPVEGAVWRIERKETVDFLVKFVKQSKIDGCYLPERSGEKPIWNIDPGTLF